MKHITCALFVSVIAIVTVYSFAGADDEVPTKSNPAATAGDIAKEWQPPNTRDVQVLTSGDDIAYARLSAKSPLAIVCKFYAAKCGYKGNTDFSTTFATVLNSEARHVIVSSEEDKSILFIHNTANATITIRISKQDGDFTKDVLVTIGMHK